MRLQVTYQTLHGRKHTRYLSRGSRPDVGPPLVVMVDARIAPDAQRLHPRAHRLRHAAARLPKVDALIKFGWRCGAGSAVHVVQPPHEAIEGFAHVALHRQLRIVCAAQALHLDRERAELAHSRAHAACRGRCRGIRRARRARWPGRAARRAATACRRAAAAACRRAAASTC
eukprot:5660869-Prymnesium_polylepis.1